MIAREHVEDLRPGDVVEIRHKEFGDATIRGAVHSSEGLAEALYLGNGQFRVRTRTGEPSADLTSLTVISRAPRPMYVNHDREKPVGGDVVRDADGGHNAVWLYGDPSDPDHLCWAQPGPPFWVGRDRLPDRLRLLVDGETGQVVP